MEVLTDWPEQRFEAGRRLVLGFGDGRREEAVVESFVERTKGAVLKLRGVDAIDDAEPLRDAELLAEREEIDWSGDEGEDAWHYSDLVGAHVVLDEGGAPIGRVREVVEGGACDLLAIALDGGGEALVPLVPQICRALDVEARVLTIDPPRGLIDLEEALVADPEEG